MIFCHPAYDFRMVAGDVCYYANSITIPGSNAFSDATTNILSSTVTIYPLPDITVTSTDDFCAHSDGSATVHVAGDSTAYNYLWSTIPTQQTTNTAICLANGIYSVTVTATFNCFHTDSLVVN